MLGYALAWEGPGNAVADDVALIASGFGLTTVYRIFYRSWRHRGASPVILTGTSIALAIAGSPAWYLLRTFITRLLDGNGLTVSKHPYLLWSGFNPEVLLYYVFVLLTWTLLYFGINGWTSLELERRRADRAESMAQSARLRALQSQLEPHFLFNTLNAISSLVVEGRNEVATAMIARLGDFLRLTLEASRTPEISLANELVFITHYLEIQKLRFGERLRFAFAVAPGAVSAMVPALVLQPLVENAVRHGILARASGGLVVITARTLAGELLLGVNDDGAGMRRSAAPTTGVGLSNTATRLSELYGSRAQFTVGPSETGGVSIAIRIPLRFEQDSRSQREASEGEE